MFHMLFKMISFIKTKLTRNFCLDTRLFYTALSLFSVVLFESTLDPMHFPTPDDSETVIRLSWGLHKYMYCTSIFILIFTLYCYRP